MSNFASSVCFNMADLFTQDYEDAQNSDEGLGSGSEGMSGDGDGDDELCDDPSSSLEEICQGARLDLLEEHQRSENPYHRQAVVRTLQSSLRAVGGSRQDAERLLGVATQLSRDVVEDIRCDLVDQVPHLAMVCNMSVDERGDSFGDLVSKHLLPIVLVLLKDPNKLIHKTAQGALLALLEQGFLPPEVVEEKLVPLVVSWTMLNDVEFNTASVGLMTKMAPIIGQKSIIQHFLQPFCDLCADNQLYVRKVCATNFGDFSAAIGPQKTEEVLLKKFVVLCRDSEWAVRKACAEVFTSMAHTVSMVQRHCTLSVVFHDLLRDESRWVQVAAFQSLGSFIAAFSDTAQYSSAHNHHVLLDTEGVELAYRAEANCTSGVPLYDVGEHHQQVSKSLVFSSQQLSQSAQNLRQDDSNKENDGNDNKMKELENDLKNMEVGNFGYYDEWDEDGEDFETRQNRAFTNFSNMYHSYAPPGDPGYPQEQLPQPPPPPPDEEEDLDEEPTVSATLLPAQETTDKEQPISDEQQSKAEEQREVGDENNFNTFQYWRLPVPELDLSDTLPPPPAPVQQTSLSPNEALCDTLLAPPMSPLASLMPDHLPSPSPNTTLPSGPTLAYDRSADSDSEQLSGSEGCPGERDAAMDLNQGIVPPVLISHFVSMATPTARTVDSEISHHCAFSLPAVVLTLGRENWPLLKKTYQNLAGDMQWKVRRTMASSIHEIASILGQDLASTDLMPIFYGFVKDLDEVRIGILKHLTEFLQILRREECDAFLPNLSKFLQMDHHSNWRYREELANQLIGVLDLCTPEQARAHVAPIALALLDDHVAAVREAALPLTAKVTRKLAEEGELLDRLISRFQELFVCTERWMRRQCFALLCGHLMRPPKPALSPDIFCDRLLPLLAGLAKDRVPNVRLAVAQSIAIDIESHPYFKKTPGSELIGEVLKELQNDEDRDVKYFSGGQSILEQDLEISVLSPLSLDSTTPYDDEEVSLPEEM